MPGPMLTGRRLVARRTVLLGSAAATLLASGCDHGDDIGARTPSADTSTSPPTSNPSTSAPAESPDEAVVDAVTTQLAAALAVAADARRLPALRGSMTSLVRAHRDHLHALEGELPPAPSGPRPEAGTALRLVRRTERQLQTALVAASGQADSGALARLLASISASVTQHLAALPGDLTP